MTLTRKPAAFVGNVDLIGRVYSQGRQTRVADLVDLYPQVVDIESIDRHLDSLAGIEVIFTTWGFRALTAEQLDRLPNLRAVFYAAGSVQGFARAYLERGIDIFSSWAANGVPVAEFTIAQVLLANKGYFRNTRAFTSRESRRQAPVGPGNFGETLALLGVGQIGRKVIELIRPFNIEVAVFDPFLSDSNAASLGVRKVTLDQAFQEGNVVSNHLANLPETVGMLAGGHFRAMREGATFINTGRGATVREDEMIEALRERPDLTALLDVTHPEPPIDGSPLYTLPNVFLSTHIAGSIGDEVVRLGDYMIEEYEAWANSQPTRYQVSLEMLATMA